MSGAPIPDAQVSAASPLEPCVGDTLDRIRSVRLGLWAPILLGLIMLFDSWDSIAIAYVMPTMSKEWGLNPAIMGALISAGYVGQFLGAILMGAVAERVGRMPVFLIAVAVMGGFALASAFSTGPTMLLALRFVQGLAIGGALPVSITYINELAPTLTRGRYFTVFQWLSMSGYSAASLLSTIIIPHLGWRWMLGIGAIPLVLMPLVWMTLPESPRWLARTGRAARVPGAIAKLGGSLTAADLALCETTTAIAERPPRVGMASLFTPQYRKRTIVLIAIWFMVAFTNFGLTTWAPSILVTVYKLPLKTSLGYAASAALLFQLATPFIGATMDRLGRRPFAIVSTLISGIALLALTTVHFASIPLLATVLVAGMFSISVCFFMEWPFTAESYPTHLRAVGLGVCSSMARAASMLTPLFVGVILSEGAPITLVYGVFAACAFASALLWIFATSETARRRLETI